MKILKSSKIASILLVLTVHCLLFSISNTQKTRISKIKEHLSIEQSKIGNQRYNQHVHLTYALEQSEVRVDKMHHPLLPKPILEQLTRLNHLESFRFAHSIGHVPANAHQNWQGYGSMLDARFKRFPRGKHSNSGNNNTRERFNAEYESLGYTLSGVLHFSTARLLENSRSVESRFTGDTHFWISSQNELFCAHVWNRVARILDPKMYSHVGLFFS